MWETAGLAAETFRSAATDERRELASVLIKHATWGEGRLVVTLKPPFDVILREVRKVRATEAAKPDSSTRTRTDGQDSNLPNAPDPSCKRLFRGSVSAEMAKWLGSEDSNHALTDPRH